MLTRIEAFLHTAERRSFRAAAAHLGLTPAAVSKAVAALEAELGARLLNRTSRQVALTPEGEIYLQHCREALDLLQTGRDRVTQAAQVAQGRVKVSSSFVLGRRIVAALPRFVHRYPNVQVQLTFSDLEVNLVEQEIDVALRIGARSDSALVGRLLRTPRWVTVASPAYLARAPALDDWTDLSAHACVQFYRPSGQIAEWAFADAPRFAAAQPVLLDQGELLVDAALAGLGVAQVFDFMAAEALARGALVEVLPHQSVSGPPIHALCLPGRQRVPRIQAFMAFAAEAVGGGGT